MRYHSYGKATVTSLLYTTRLLIMVLVVAAAALAQEPTTQRLRYVIGRLGNARKAVSVSPGPEDNGACFRLETELGSWSRFNWPRFEPVPELRSVAFRIRRAATAPSRCHARVLHRDGTEWQTRQALPVADQWQRFELSAADFQLFRGAAPEEVAPLAFADVVQFQLVPSSAGQGTGVLLVDDIVLSPNGPTYAVSEAELLPARALRERDSDRLADLVGRWQQECRRLKKQARFARAWHADLKRLIDQWSAAERRQAIRQQVKRDDFAWQRRNVPGPDQTTPGPDLAAFKRSYMARLGRLSQRQPEALIDFLAALELTWQKLYDAVAQQEPRIVSTEGHRFLRHEIRFSESNTRQTVFTVIDPGKPLSVIGRKLRVRMRCVAPELNATYPLLLRLRTSAPDGAESWADLRPEPFPQREWGWVSFDPRNPLRSVRFEPGAVSQIQIRMENSPGTGGTVLLEVDTIELTWPKPEIALRRRIIAETDEQVARAQMGLYRVRDSVAALENELQKGSDVRDLYLRSFLAPAPRTPQPRPEVRAFPQNLSMPDHQVGSHTIVSTTDVTPEGVKVNVRFLDVPLSARLLAELYDSSGGLVAGASAAGPRGTVVMSVPEALLWQTETPALYRLRAAVVREDQVVTYTDRRIGLRSIDCTWSPLDPLLRHAIGTPGPDWALYRNGEPWFPRMACYHWPRQDETWRQGIRMLRELWVDGFRDYGFRFRPTVWDQCDSRGIARLISRAPSYRALGDWDDVSFFRDQYSQMCRQSRQNTNRALTAMTQIGNEVELTVWGADLGAAFPGAPYHPLDVAAEVAGSELHGDTPVMYVRGGSFRKVPPLPHEDICGVNQYTGRYGGRIDEVARNLAELGRQSLVADRPLAITEWNGPKYSWASSGVGGVTRRGCAYYVERYYGAMTGTPGIVASSEFTLNWIIAPFEDFTTQSREQAMRDRPPHDPFGGGRTADHVPLVAPTEAIRGPTYRSMQAFHGPFYHMVNRPGDVWLLSGRGGNRLANALASRLRVLGKRARLRDLAEAQSLRAVVGHVVLLAPPETREKLLDDLRATGVIEKDVSANEAPPEPSIQRRLNPMHPEFLLVVLTAPTGDAFARGGKRLLESLGALVELAEMESKMGRAIALTDARLKRYYRGHILEFAARGFLFGGDDVREHLQEEEFFDPTGGRRPAWADLFAIILDCQRQLSAAELSLVDRLYGEGANCLISRACYAANPGLQQRFPASLGPSHSLAEPFAVATALRSPVAVADMGSVDLEAIERFRPDLATDEALLAVELSSTVGEPVVTAANGKPIVLRFSGDGGQCFVFGTGLGAAEAVHWSVTHAGRTHPLYDRDTACGLERINRVLVNACLAGHRKEAPIRPRLRIRIAAESTIAHAVGPVRLAAHVTDTEGKPVPAQLRARTRIVADARAGGSTPYREMTPSSTGVFDITGRPSASASEGSGFKPTGELLFAPPPENARQVILSIQLKAHARGFIPADAGFAVVLWRGRIPNPSESARSEF